MSFTGWTRNSNEVDDAEVPASPAERPEQVFVLTFAGDEGPSVGGHDVGRDEVVERQAEAPAEVADPAAEREPADAGRGDDAAGGRQAVGVRRVVEVAPRGAALGARGAVRRVDGDVAHRRQVDHDAAVAGAEAGHAVPAAAHGQVESTPSRAKFTAATTSSAFAARTTTAGRLSIIAL